MLTRRALPVIGSAAGIPFPQTTNGTPAPSPAEQVAQKAEKGLSPAAKTALFCAGTAVVAVGGTILVTHLLKGDEEETKKSR